MFGESKVVNLCLSNRCCHTCIFCGDVRSELPALTTRQIERKLDRLRR